MFDIKKRGLFGIFFSITGVILISKLLGFVKQMITAGAFGATLETDLINLSEGFIGNAQYVLVQVLLTAFVAVYIHTQKEDERAARQLAVDVGKAFTLIAGAIVLLILSFAPAIARVLAPTYSAEDSARLAFYLRLFAPSLFFFVWSAIFHALLNANQRFIPGQLEGINQSVILILLMLTLQTTMGVQVLALAFLIYAVWNAFFLGAMARPYWTDSRGSPFQNPGVKQLLRMSGPLLLGYSMVYINQQVGKILVSGLEAGTVTAMGYAGVLSNLVGTLIGTFCSILFPYITTHISKGEDTAAAKLVTHSAVMLMTAFLPITILTILCSEEIVSIVFGRGAFNAENVQTAALALSGYAVMFVPLVLRELFSRFQYGYQNSKTPMVNSTIGIAANIILSIVLLPRFGVFGVTFASSVSVCICGILNAITAKKDNANFRLSSLLTCLPWLCLAGMGCVFAAQWILETVPTPSPLLRFTAATLCGGGAYLLLAFPLIRTFFRRETV